MIKLRVTWAVWALFGIYLGYIGLSQAVAQESGGQFCVRSYEDANANGIFDTETERLVTRGVGVELLDPTGIVVSSALLDRSPNASLGLICFYSLSAGEYAVFVSSADYVATTERLVYADVTTTAPTIVEFGGRRISSLSAASPATTGGDDLLAQIASPTGAQLIAAGIGSVVIMLLLAIVGIVIYGVRANRRARLQPVSYSSDSVRTLEPTDQNEAYAQAPLIDEPPVSADDTNPTNPQ